jgi:general secretion pathway protein L
MNSQAILASIKNAFIWWGHGLLAWLPKRWIQKLYGTPIIKCVITADLATLSLVDKQGVVKDELCFNLSSQQADRSLIDAWLNKYKATKAVLQISDDESLITHIHMPSQAKNNLVGMLDYEIDRQTPFAVEDVYYSHHFDDNKREGNSLLVTLAVVPKQFVVDRVVRLAEFSVSITELLLTNSTQTPIAIPLTESKPKQSALICLNISLLVLATMLMLMLMYKPVLYYQQQMDALQPALNDMKKQAQHVSQLKKQNEALHARGQFLTTISNQYYSKLVILNELAERLPSHTWLTFSEFKNTSLTLYGQSEAATDLIELLTNTGHFESVRFIAPLTHDKPSGKDLFRIEAVFKPGWSYAVNG